MMHMKPHPDPHHAILNLEGGDEEVLHLWAFGKDLKIEIRVDEAKTGVVIATRKGMFGQAIPGRRLFDEADMPIVPKETDAREGAV